MEHLLRQAFFALLHLPGSTLLDVSNLLRHASDEGDRIRSRILQVVENAAARPFWVYDFKKYGKDEFGPPRNKLSKLLVSDTVSLMLSQPTSAFALRRVMDDGMILLANLSTVGSEVRDILGCLLLSLLHLTALSRSDTPIDKRRPFHIYCDEAHRFMTDALDDLIAETRKFGVSLTIAHQYRDQFSKRKAGARSSVGTTIIFNVDTEDARHLVKNLRGLISADDLIALELGESVVRAGTEVVRIKTPLPVTVEPTNQHNRIIAESRRRYCKPAHEVRRAIRQGQGHGLWSAFGNMTTPELARIFHESA